MFNNNDERASIIRASYRDLHEMLGLDNDHVIANVISTGFEMGCRAIDIVVVGPGMLKHLDCTMLENAKYKRDSNEK